jgi:tRNA(adenine34) deaminase
MAESCGHPDDGAFMRLALAEAEAAGAAGEVPIGCVIVLGGRVIGRGRNARERTADATAHAEILAIGAACGAIGDWRLAEATLYVTVEPCPMCLGACLNARIARVVYGCREPKAGACGSVVDLTTIPFNHRLSAEGGVCAEQSAALLRGFFRQRRGGGDDGAP